MGRQSSTQFGALGETEELPGHRQAEKLHVPVHGEASEFRGEEEQGHPWKEEGDSALHLAARTGNMPISAMSDKWSSWSVCLIQFGP